MRGVVVALLALLLRGATGQWGHATLWSSLEQGFIDGDRPQQILLSPVDDWPALRTLTLDYIDSVEGQYNRVKVAHAGPRVTYVDADTLDEGDFVPRWALNAAPQAEWTPDHHLEDMNSSEAHARLRAGEGLFISVPLARDLLEPLLPTWPAVIPGGRARLDKAHLPHLFISAADGGGFGTHYDMTANTFVQLQGRKEFLLWPPEDAPFFHEHPPSSKLSRQMQLDPLAPPWDPARFPLAGRWREPLRFELRNGDVLFIPPGWVHRVTCLAGDPCMSLSFMTDVPSCSPQWEIPREPMGDAPDWFFSRVVRTLDGFDARQAWESHYAPTFRPQRHRRFCRGADALEGAEVRIPGLLPTNDVDYALWVTDVALFVLQRLMGADEAEAKAAVPALWYDCVVR